MKAVAFLVCNFVLFAYAKVPQKAFEVFMRTEEATEDLEGEIVFQEETNYEVICESHIPTEWTTDGKFSSHWTDSTIWRSTDFYKNILEAKYTQSATGYLTCEPLEKSLENMQFSKGVYVYVNGSSPFAESGNIKIDFNKLQNMSKKRVIPCRTTLPTLVPKLHKIIKGQQEMQINNRFNPRIGFTLDFDIKPGEKYKCCIQEVCVEYQIQGKPFHVSPTSTSVQAVTKTPLVLQCQGGHNLTIEYDKTGGERINVTTKKVELFSGGPSTIKNIVVDDIQAQLQIKCSDGDKNHTWTILPPAIYTHLDNQTAKYFYQRNVFECRLNSTSFFAKNLLCENSNSCALKSKCLEDDSCPKIIKPGLSCAEPLCLAIGHPYPTGIYECGTDDSKYTITYFTGLDQHKYDVNDEVSIPLDALVRIHEVPLPHYHGHSEPFVVYCQHVLFTLAREAEFSFKFENGTIRLIREEEQLEQTDEEYEKVERMHFRDSHAKSIKIDPVPQVKEIICSVPKVNTMGFVSASRKVQIIQAKSPEIVGWIEEKTILTDESAPVVIVCNVTGQPEPIVSWRKVATDSNFDEQNNTTNDNIFTNGSILSFTKIEESIAGLYNCQAENGVGSATQNLKVEVKHNVQSSTTNYIWAVASSLGIVLCGMIALTILYRRRRMQLNELVRFLSEKEVQEFFKGNLSRFAVNNAEDDAAEIVHQLPYNNLYEITNESLQISENKILGIGNFGLVYKGILDSNKPVAVKTITNDSDKKAFLALLLEIKVMIHVGYHPHVVEFLGAVTKNIKQMEVLVVVEFCLNGDIQTYLKSGNCAQVDAMCNRYANYNPTGESDYLELEKASISTAQMLQWSLQICLGVEHLAKRKVVHGDIAARNVLLDSNLCVKIADFGLSNHITNYSEYVKMGQAAPLPWRWMALESLETYRFSYASDVWSVGITIWEIFSFGNTPYPGMTWNFDFVQDLASGLRLTRPQICPAELYEAIKETWNPSPKKRISLSSLQELIKLCMN